MYTFLQASSIPLLAEVDILIVGAGSAGCVAALAARQSQRHSVLLVERYGFPGGTSTQMLDTFYGFFTPGPEPKKVVGGWPDRVVDELHRLGEVFLRPNTYGAGTGVNYNPERLKNVWDRLLVESGTQLLLHTHLVDVAQQEGERSTCILWNKAGFWRVLARRIIDASGDADFCHLAGYAYERAGDLEPAQSMTTTFRLSNVDQEAFERAGGKKMLLEKMQIAVDSGRHPLPRKEGSVHEMNAARCVSTVAVKVAGLQALDPQQLTEAEMEGRRQAFVYETFFKSEVPGFEHSNLIGLSTQIGIRETRRVYGEHRLTREECLSGFMPQDRILLCGAPIEDHRQGKGGEEETYWQYIPDYGVYGVPYGTIVPKGSLNTWVIGRCFSATHDAHASCRSMAQTMSMGQAAGLAAVRSLDGDCSPAQVNIHTLQSQLLAIGQILDKPEMVADISRNGWGV